MRTLIDRLEEFQEKTGMSQAGISKALGIGNSTLSEWMKGKYKGNNEALEEKVADYLERHKQKMKRIDFSVETDVRKRIFNSINMLAKLVTALVHDKAEDSAKIVFIYGRAGIGKTKGLHDWIAQSKMRTYFITAETGNSEAVLIRKLARAIGLSDEGRVEKIKNDIKATLKWTESIIIIDEGEHLKAKAIDMIRSICDQTQVGLVVCGTKKLQHQILSNRGEYEYLSSRALTSMVLPDLGITDVNLIVREFLKDSIHLYKDNELVDIIKLINTTINGSGRILSNLLSLSHEIANNSANYKNDGGLITELYIKAAAKRLQIF